MLTNVNFSCGHSAEVNLSNNEQKRLDKIAELELHGLCPECRREEWEKEDKKNSQGCACVRTSIDLYEKQFSYCKERLTGYPKEKDFTYIYVPYEDIIVETLRKYIAVHGVPFEEAMTAIREKFEKKYPEEFNKLRPVSTNETEKEVEPTPVQPVEPVAPVVEQPKVVKPVIEAPVVEAPKVVPEAKPVVETPAPIKEEPTPIVEQTRIPQPVDIDDPYADFDAALDMLDAAPAVTPVQAPVVPKVPVAPVAPVEAPKPIVKEAPAPAPATSSTDDLFNDSFNFDDISTADLEKEASVIDDDLDKLFDDLDNFESETVTPETDVFAEPAVKSEPAPAPKPAANNSASTGGSAVDSLDAELDDLLKDFI